MKLKNKIEEVGFRNFSVGCVRRVWYYRLNKKYGFDTWHISPIEHRKYALDAVDYINSSGNLSNGVADIGCGLGDVLRKVKASKRVGFDLSKETIAAAKYINRKHDISFEVGSFEKLQGYTLDYLVTLGFMHGSREDTWKEPYQSVARNNDIKNFIVDVIPEGVNNSCELDFSKILPSQYYLKQRLGPFLSGRYVEIWSKKSE